MGSRPALQKMLCPSGKGKIIRDKNTDPHKRKNTGNDNYIGKYMIFSYYLNL